MPYKSKEDQRKAQKRHYDANRARYRDRTNNRKEKMRRDVAAIKEAGQCTDCGGSFHSCLMDFDHVDPQTKTAGIATMVSSAKNLAEILSEIEKCELVCAMCHRIRTWNRAHPNDQITSWA